MAALTVIRPGMLTTVQDLGRWGQQHLGVPVAGPMDWYSHRLANGMLGNPPEAATLEITLIGPELVSDADVVCAITGAEFEVVTEDRRVRSGEPFALRAGEHLRFGARLKGTRATFGVSGGFDTQRVLGSRATSLISRLGPFGGRALKVGDVLPLGAPGAVVVGHHGRPMLIPHGGARLRILPGPHGARFREGAWAVFEKARYVVTPDSNRMGYRLDGPRLDQADGPEVLSDATPIGSVQVPASGCPILLMADRQTTGGYPRIGTVITADLCVAGQMGPGDWIEFETCSRAAAVEALRRREAGLQGAVS